MAEYLSRKSQISSSKSHPLVMLKCSLNDELRVHQPTSVRAAELVPRAARQPPEQRVDERLRVPGRRVDDGLLEDLREVHGHGLPKPLGVVNRRRSCGAE